LGSTSAVSDALDSLVSDGTITSDQANAIFNSMNSDSADVSDGSNPLKTTLDSLVNDGTISSDQESSIAEALAPKDDGAASGLKADKPMGPPPPPPADSEDDSDEDDEDYLEELLQSLVEKGTLSDDQQNAIESAISSISSDSDTDSSSIQVTLDNLLNAGTISDDQANAILEALNPSSMD